MFRRLLAPGLLAVLAAALVITACGSNPTSPSTTSPGGTQALSTGATGGTGSYGATGNGTANGSNQGNGSNNGNGSDNGNGSGNGPKNPNSVILRGLVSAVSGSCPSLTFTANSISVTTSSATVFHGMGCANLKIGGRVEVKGFPQSDGSIKATWVTVNGDDGDEGDKNETEMKGTLSGMGGTCPAVTFTVNGTTVTTTAQTTFTELTCSQLQNGTTVEVEGVKQTDGSVTAMKVDSEYYEVKGTVSGMGGTCPAVTFTVNGTTVTTTAQTTFKGAVCTLLKNGMNVEIKGLFANGCVTAVVVSFDD